MLWCVSCGNHFGVGYYYTRKTCECIFFFSTICLTIFICVPSSLGSLAHTQPAPAGALGAFFLHVPDAPLHVCAAQHTSAPPIALSPLLIAADFWERHSFYVTDYYFFFSSLLFLSRVAHRNAAVWVNDGLVVISDVIPFGGAERHCMISVCIRCGVSAWACTIVVIPLAYRGRYYGQNDMAVVLLLLHTHTC